MNPIQWLETRAWQVGAIGAAAVCLILGAALIASAFEVRGLERDKARLEKRVSDLSRDLGTCQANERKLERSVADQNAEIEDLSERGAQAIADAQTAVAQVRRENRILERRIAGLLAAPAAGDTVCERIDTVDEAVVEAFR